MRKENKSRSFLSIISIVIVTLSVFFATTSHVEAKSNSNKVDSELLQKGTLTVGLEGTYAPYSYRKNTKLTGFEVDLARQIAKRSHLKVKYVPTKWDSLIAGLGSKKFDVVLNDITITPQRQKQYLFSTPYIYSRGILITRSNDTSINSVSDIKGKKFAEGTGTNNETIAKKFGANTVPSGDFDTSLALVREKRVDGTINAREAWFAYAKQKSTKGLKYQVIPNSKAAAAKIGVLINKNSPKLQKQVNKALKKLKANGTLTKLSKKYFGADITK
ncbi:MAG: transporter substrate-binding domain-containing protein [Lentilactobacillus hilgardii]|uniref:transporter substrate-binding domain-containing protein n=1 Tax=Lactobacillaceae TaxID=33958 RepID=UPI0010B9E48E|nr:putative amino-acid ABC transporter-binding protein precursor [Oenococcus sicerae]